MPRGPFNFHLQSSDHTSSLIPPALCRVVFQLSPTIVRPQLLFDTTGFMPRGPFNFHLQSSDHNSSLIPPALCRVVLSTFTNNRPTTPPLLSHRLYPPPSFHF